MLTFSGLLVGAVVAPPRGRLGRPLLLPLGGWKVLRALHAYPQALASSLVKSCYCLACLFVSPVCVCVCGCQCLCLVCVPVLHSIAGLLPCHSCHSAGRIQGRPATRQTQPAGGIEHKSGA